MKKKQQFDEKPVKDLEESNDIPGAPVARSKIKSLEKDIERSRNDLQLQKEEYDSLLKASDNLRARHDVLIEENARYKQQLMNKNFQILNLVAKMFGNEQDK